MKKGVIFPVLLSIVVLFTGCVGGEFIGLDSFIDRWNLSGENEISFNDFSVVHAETEDIYSAIFETVAIRLSANENKNIWQCKVMLLKKDSSLKALNIDNAMISDFASLCIKTVCCFCDYNEDDANSIINEFALNDIKTVKANGELTKNKDNYNFVYYSTDFMCEFIITNALLSEIESTMKPESKIAFADTTETRLETVPHD